MRWDECVDEDLGDERVFTCDASEEERYVIIKNSSGYTVYEALHMRGMDGRKVYYYTFDGCNIHIKGVREGPLHSLCEELLAFASGEGTPITHTTL